MSHGHSECGGASCSCHGGPAVATVNGFVLHGHGEQLDEEALRERAWSELLRQEAVRQGLLPRHEDDEAPALSAGDRQVIEAMLAREVAPAAPTQDECRRFYEARQDEYVEGAQVHARHILFAVTRGVDVRRLAARAEQALLELSRHETAPSRFGEMARELSNCPSGAAGGDLGWFGPRDCAPELARELFRGAHRRALGLRPRLVHSRYGFHIIEVMERRPGRQASFEEVSERIALQLVEQARARALHQYMQLLAGRATIAGVALAGTDSPLVQ